MNACGDDEAPPATPRSTATLLVDRTVGGYVLAALVGSMGSWIHNVVAAVVVYDASRSALLVGLVSVVQFVPQLLLSPWMGALADRGDRQRQVVVGRSLISVGSGSLAAWLWLVGGEGLSLAWMVIAAGSVVGIGFAVSIPAMQSITPALARPSELPAVVALASSPMTLARAAGPATGAFLLVTLGPAWAFAAAAGGQAFFSVVVARLRLRPVDRPENGETDSVFDGVRYVRRDRALLLLLIGVTAIGFGVDPVITLTPPLASGFGRGAELVALMATSFGLGAASLLVVLGALRRRIGQDAIGFGGLVVLAGSMAFIGLSSTVAAVLVGFLVGGLGMMAAVTGMTTQLHDLVREEYRGRVMALWAVAFVGSRPFAATVNGLVTDLASVEVALLLLAAVLFGMAMAVRPSRLARASQRGER